MKKEGGDSRTMNEVQNIFKELKPEYIRTSLKKLWLEDFYEFCETKLNATSKAMMCDLLKFEADLKLIIFIKRVHFLLRPVEARSIRKFEGFG